MKFKGTGVFATESEKDVLRCLIARGWKPGERMMVHSLAEGVRKDKATFNACLACHDTALRHGLPEINGYYGIAEDGEFVEAVA